MSSAAAMVVCVSEDGREFARGFGQLRRRRGAADQGRPSSEIAQIPVGYVDEDELIHRDNLVLL